MLFKIKCLRNLSIVVLCVAALSAHAQYDLLLRNARIVDGTGAPWFRGDVAIKGDTITRIALSITEPATRVIDVKGAVVAPGFVDIHTHAIRGIFQAPTADNYIRQGVTTILEGPDGGSPVPIKPFLDKLDATPKSINIGTFIGQGSVRQRVVGLANRNATAEELDRMRALVKRGMEDGAFGLSTGLFYVPGRFTPLAEIVELQKVAGPMGGVHTSHMRDEAAGVADSVTETIAIGEQGGLPTHVSHHKMIGKANWGRSAETLKLIDDARARGVDATVDLYPYTASATSIQAALMPAWSLEGGNAEMLKRLKDPATRAKIKAEIANIIRNERGGGDARNVVTSTCPFDMSLAGKNLAELTQMRGMEPTPDNAAEVVMGLEQQGGCRGVFHAASEDDVVRVMRHPAAMIASDGEVTIFGRAVPHPRSYGAFARILGVYVREKKVLTLEEAVRKMSAMPAARIGLTDRGLLRPGMKADLVVFDPVAVRDMATFEKPHQYAEGFAQVIVNGQMVFENGAMTAARPGRTLYGPARRSP